MYGSLALLVSSLVFLMLVNVAETTVFLQYVRVGEATVRSVVPLSTLSM